MAGRRANTAGGNAAAAGMNYQARVAAWFAAYILAEQGAPRLFGLPVSTCLETVLCESGQDVDDVLVGTSASGFIFVQAKRRLSASPKPDSEFASVFRQFTDQFLSWRTANGQRPWERPLDLNTDRLVLATTSNSPQTICRDLKSILSGVKCLVQGQPLADAASNRPEREILEHVVLHAKTEWLAKEGAAPSDEELITLLSFAEVLTLDVDPNGRDERDAGFLLKSCILRSPNDSANGWSTLVGLCLTLAEQSGAADRRYLQRHLLNSGMGLNVPQSFKDDVERINAFSRTIHSRLLSHAMISRPGSNAIKIQRSVKESIGSFSLVNSFLLVGEPGIGKSGIVDDIYSGRDSTGKDVILLSVEGCEARSLEGLRQQLNLSHEFITVLDNWPGTDSAVLFIDGLDAARADQDRARMFYTLIDTLLSRGGRWNIVASVRTYDLRYADSLRDLFTGPFAQPIDGTYQLAEFSGIRHILIPRLLDEELDQLQTQEPNTYALVCSASNELKELLRVPFNLELSARLLSADTAVEEILSIRTQNQLLEKFWRRRVIQEDRDGRTREQLLRDICRAMLDGAVLRIDPKQVVATSFKQVESLLSERVLDEWQASPEVEPDRHAICFSHNLIFDYAVCVLLLHDEGELVGLLRQKRDLVVFLGPALRMRFEILWEKDRCRGAFWKLLSRLTQEPLVPRVSNVLGATAAVQAARTVSDFEPLLHMLESANERPRQSAEQAFRYLVGSLLAAPERLFEDGGEPWAALVERVSATINRSTAYSLRPVLFTLCDKPDVLRPESLTEMAVAAQRLFQFARSQAPRDGMLVKAAIRVICRTSSADPLASSAILRECFEKESLREHGYEEIPEIAHEASFLSNSAPNFLVELYGVAFSFQEESDDKTAISDSQLLRMTSNRAQDYGMAHYSLSEAFPQFLNARPTHAVRALIRVLESFENRDPYEHTVHIFAFRGQEARISDRWGAWSEVIDHRCTDPQYEMLDALDNYLDCILQTNAASGVLDAVLQVIVRDNTSSSLWRHLLLVGAKYPEVLGVRLFPLLQSLPVLTLACTSDAAGELLKTAITYLTDSDHIRAEEAILAIPDYLSGTDAEDAELLRNRFLGCIGLTRIMTDLARNVLEQAEAVDRVPQNLAPPKMRCESSPVSHEMALREQGIDTEAQPNDLLLDKVSSVKELLNRTGNSILDPNSVRSAVSVMLDLIEFLQNPGANAPDPKLIDDAWGCVAESCSLLLDYVSALDKKDVDIVISLLLDLSTYPKPTYDPNADAHFDKHPSWGSPAARIDAAVGLLKLSRNPDLVTADIVNAIRQLSCDPVPAVRYQVAVHLQDLARLDLNLVWSLLEYYCMEEVRSSILGRVIQTPLSAVLGYDPSRTAALTNIVFERAINGFDSPELVTICLVLFSQLSAIHDEPSSKERIQAVIEDPSAHGDAIREILLTMRMNECLVWGPLLVPDPCCEALRQRAISFILNILSNTIRDLSAIQAEYEHMDFSKWPVSQQERTRSLVRILESISVQIRCLCTESARSSPAQIQRFYNEGMPILEHLSDVGFPEVVHNLLTILKRFIAAEPRGVLLLVARSLRAGTTQGYNNESLGARQFVNIVETYLANNRDLLQDDTECRSELVNMLDSFVTWPEALRLLYRLHEVYR